MRYPIRWSADSKTLTLEKSGNDSDTKTKTVVGELVFNAVGETSDPTVRPAPKQHLMALAMKAGENDFALIKVENATGNKTLDYLEQEADAKKTAIREDFEAKRVKPATGGPATTPQVKAVAEGDRGLEGEALETAKEAAKEDKGVQTLERVEGKEGKETGGDTA